MRLVEVLNIKTVRNHLMEDRVGFLIGKYASPVANRFAADPEAVPADLRSRIPNPCPKAQMIAVRKDPSMINYIENPSVKVTAYAAMKGKVKQYTHKEFNDPPDDQGRGGNTRTVHSDTLLGRLMRRY